MATVRVSVDLPVGAEEAWAVICDFAHADELLPGFVARCEPDDEGRLITFADGHVVRDALVEIDHESRRLCYRTETPMLSHHNAAMTVRRRDLVRCELDWTADILPDAMAPMVRSMMEAGAAAMRTGLAG